MTPAELKALMDAGEPPVLVDVREDWELDIAALDGAQHIPMDEIPGRIAELDRDADIVVYCHTGARSGQVAMFLARSGFPRVHNLDGGIHAWAMAVDPEMAVY